jgi:hypothetical protein
MSALGITESGDYVECGIRGPGLPHQGALQLQTGMGPGALLRLL